ncbi:pleiotropic drug resistance ABC transporter [Sparassis latifolia]
MDGSTFQPEDDDALSRRNSMGAHSVDIGMFDPEGVRHLRKTLFRRNLLLRSHNRRQSFSAAAEPTLSSAGRFDLEKALRRAISMLDESDIKTRELGVAFRNLRVVGLGATALHQPTVGSVLNPWNFLKSLLRLRHPPLRDILSDFEGVVRSGEMLLVLGRPGAGCSTFLRVLANQREEYHGVYGDVFYDSFSPADIHRHYRGDVQYSPETDDHFPSLTVEQTLKFAARTRAPQQRIGGMSRDRYIEIITDILLTMFGLRLAKKTRVGDASIRGVSGGEKKRVSICETLATRSRLTCWDKYVHPFLASTALEFIQALRLATDIMHSSTVISAYQAGESLYRLCDKVCLLYEGRMAYFGPADHAREYFIDMGYEPAHRQTTADFLVAITDPNGRNVRPGYEQRVPRTASEFAAYFSQSELGQLNRADIESYCDEFVGKPQRVSEYKASALAEHSKSLGSRSSFITSIPMQVRALVVRRTQIVKGAAGTQVIRTISFVLQAIIVGTIFLKMPKTTAAYFSRDSVLFFAILFTCLSSAAEIPALFAQRPIVLRHSKAAMYHPFVDSLALSLVDLPITFFTIVLFCVVLYFLAGLQRTAGQFFIFLLVIFLVTITMKGWFRALAASFSVAPPALTAAGFSVLVLTLYTGFTIPQPAMIGALRWLTYLNPVRYGFEAMVVNEFHNLYGSCSTLIPQGDGYENVTLANQVCTTLGSLPGQAEVSGSRYVQMSYGYVHSHLWRNVGITIVFFIGFLVILLILTEINTGAKGNTDVLLYKRGSHPEALKQAKAAARGEDIEKQPASEPSIQGSVEDENKAEIQNATRAAPPPSETFSFQDLCYTVHTSDGDRLLLDSVSGYVPPGKLTALMGETGAGKTTLLNVLAERTIGGVVTGDRFMNGHVLPADFKARTGYCQQTDTHLETASVREALMFSAILRQPQSTPYAEKCAYVEKCLEMCGLMPYADAIVGSLGVEHRKRTTIGVELVAKPSLIFLDEPTSGLDSQSAWAIMTFLRDLADSGQAIVCTIHQPSAELFQVFDRLLLLCKGGETVYFGDVGKRATTLLDYFERNGGRPCGEAENPAEYILDVIGAGATATADRDWFAIWKNSKEIQKLQEELEQLHAEGRKGPPIGLTVGTTFPTSWFHQFAMVFQRCMQSQWRNPMYIMAKLALNVIGGLFIGFTFFKSKNTVQGTQDKLFSIFMSTVLSVSLTHQVQVIFIEMRDIYEIREQHSNMYSWSALVTAQMLVEIPFNFLGSLIFFLCWYWTVALPGERAGFTYLLFGVVYPFYYVTIGETVAAMSPTAEIAGIVFSFLFTFVLAFNGVLQPYRVMGWWRWMYHVTPFTYLIEALLTQALGKKPIVCSAAELVTVDPPTGLTCTEYLGRFIAAKGGYVTNGNATSSCRYCAYATADAFLEQSFNMYYKYHWRDFGLFFVYIIFNIVATYACTYVFRIRGQAIIGWLKKHLPLNRIRTLRRKD